MRVFFARRVAEFWEFLLLAKQESTWRGPSYGLEVNGGCARLPQPYLPVPGTKIKTLKVSLRSTIAQAIPLPHRGGLGRGSHPPLGEGWGGASHRASLPLPPGEGWGGAFPRGGLGRGFPPRQPRSAEPARDKTSLHGLPLSHREGKEKEGLPLPPNFGSHGTARD